MSGLISGRSFDSAVPHREPGPRITDPCPRDVPELPSIADDCRQQQPANMKLARALNPRATHENTLVMRSSLGGDEDQGAEVPRVVRDRRRRARCVPDRPVNAGNPRSLTDTFTRLLTCAWTGPSIAVYVLLSNRSRVRVAVGAAACPDGDAGHPLQGAGGHGAVSKDDDRMDSTRSAWENSARIILRRGKQTWRPLQ